MKFIEIENQYYILAASALSDQRVIVIKEGESFGLFDVHGDIYSIPGGTQGIFHNGTRFLSQVEMEVNGVKPLLLSSFPREDNQMIIVDLTNPDIKTDGEAVLRGTVHISRSKFLWQGAYFEKIRFSNFSQEAVAFDVDLKFDADFSDIFEVRGQARLKRGFRFPTETTASGLRFSYKGLDDVMRETVLRFTPEPDEKDPNGVRHHVVIDAQGEFEIEVVATFSDSDTSAVRVLHFNDAKNEMNTYIEKIGKFSAEIYTSNEQCNQWINRSKHDLITMTTRTAHGLYPYAGIPWYSTAFGRDGIITAMECLWVEPELTRGVLNYLAQTQAKDFNDFQDAEPGKIFHETRGGEMAALKETPFQLYYGTIDATPLFVSLAGMYLERTNDLATLRSIWPNIKNAIMWINNFGDIDKDGFVEYKTKSSKGLTNQGWKDSFDSVFYDDGDLAQEPIALCEVQGYVYDAKLQASKIARALGHEQQANEWMTQAENLKAKFNEKFWSEEKQIYALALDGQKRPCNVVSSNAGHCLFSGIATAERARLTANNLLNEKMFSGWGIRTIASGEPRYNPMSYHNGSIWPHDNALIAYGFARYCMMDEVAKVMKGVFDTALHSPDFRLPELFCGFERVKGQGLTSYPVACSPQAWSVGSLFLLIQACLGLRIDAAENTVHLHQPTLPSFLKEITVSNLRINNNLVIIQVRKTHDGVDAQLLTPGTHVNIEIHAKPKSDSASDRDLY